MNASPLLEPDSTRWGCETRACRLLLDRLDSSPDPRVRDAALVGRFAREPFRWFDRLLARWEAGATLVNAAVLLGRGVLREDGTPVPEGTDWRAWRAWWSDGRGLSVDPGDALRIYSARTGRDPLAELVSAWPPEGDSARTVVSEVPSGLGAFPERSPAELREALLSGDEARVRLARAELRHRMHREGRPMDPGAVAELLSPLIHSIFARGGSPWPSIEGERWDLHSWSTTSHGLSDVPVFLITGNLPRVLLRDLPTGVSAITPEEWAARDRRVGGHAFRFTRMKRWGPFFYVSWRWTAWDRRAPGESPRGFGGGGWLHLVETADGLRVANAGAVIS